MQAVNRWVVLVVLVAACGLDNQTQKNECSEQADCLDGYVCTTAGTCEMQTVCTPNPCEANQCGMVDDGCGGKVACGGCPSGLACGLAAPNQCGTPPPHCTNGWQDASLGETGVDCGGDCMGCPTGGACHTAGDCADGNTCEQDVCLAGTWSTVAPLPTPRQHLAAVLGPDGLIYTLGGIAEGQGGGKTGVLEVYNPATNSWSTRSPMPTPRYGLAAVLGTDGKIYAIGGQYNNTTSPSTDGDSVKVEAYNPATDTWEAKPSLPNGRYYPAAEVGLDGAIYVSGGFSVNPIETLGSTVKLAPGATSWIALTSPMTNARSSHAMARTPDGKLWAFAGYSNAGVELKTVEWMLPGTPGWNTAPPFTYYRKYATASLSGDNIYLIGGNAPGVSILNPIVEVFSPATNTWSRASSMPAGRYGHAAVTMPDGRIVVIGGQRAVNPPSVPNDSTQSPIVDVLTP
jgi:N-acetylneuraminic acid mutarotase